MLLSERGQWLPVVVAAAAAVVVVACRAPAAPSNKRNADPTPPALPASATLPTRSVPLLVAETIGHEGDAEQFLHPIEGAMLVSEGHHVGRIVDGTIAWMDTTTIPPKQGAPGYEYDNSIIDLHGRWPDAVDVVYAIQGGRGPGSPTYLPLTGKGTRRTFDAAGKISGIATIGKSTIVSGFTWDAGHQLVTVRGPRLPLRHLWEAEAGCTADERSAPAAGAPRPPAIEPQVFAATAAGTAISVGEVCARRAPGAEVWDSKTGRSKVVDLGRWFSRPFRAQTILAGRDDEAWIIPEGWSRIVHFRDGHFDTVPDLERPIVNTFVGVRGELHASDGEVIYRLEQDAWTPVGRLEVPDRPFIMAMDASGAVWAGSGGSNARVFRLRERGLGVVSQAPVCATPFVFLYELPFRDANVRFPATRKSLASFPGASQVELVELLDWRARHLGARVVSRAQGDALVAHLRDTMKDIDPRFLCFDSRTGQKVDMSTGPEDRQHEGD